MKKVLDGWTLMGLQIIKVYGILIFLTLGWGIALRLGALKLNWSFSILRLWIEVLAVSYPLK